MALRSRDAFEARPRPVEGGAGRQSPYLLGPQPEDPRVGEILAMADGGSSVADVAARLGVTPSAGWRELVALLRYLWQNNALTWLPPAGAVEAPVGGAAFSLRGW